MQDFGLLLDRFSEPTLMAFAGLFGGILLGLAARLGRFCTLGAIEDLYYGASSVRFAMWGVALGVAIIGTFALSATGLLTLSETLYLSAGWNPYASVVGGLMFGYGMAMAGNCGYGALARMGCGDLRSFMIVTVMGVSAYVALGGPLSALRLALFPIPEAGSIPSSYAHLLAGYLAVDLHIVGITLGALLIIITLFHKGLRASPSSIGWGVVAGLAIVSGWAGTQWVTAHGFDRSIVVSHTYTAPVGETLLYVMTSSGNTISFGTGSVIGVVIGSLLGCLLKGHLRWEACEDPRELRRQLAGAVLMGIGAVIAIGCSVGQGLSAFSVLAYGAPVTLACIVLGAAIGLRQLIEGFRRIA
jgi:uncharacterized membrane protein YedE/YeeE